MAKKKIIDPPACAHCAGTSRLTTGAEIYRGRADLADKNFWKCECGAYVGCHGRTKRPLGTCANAQLRDARSKLHDLRFDPIWRGAISQCGYKPEDSRAAAIILATSRARLYHWLAEQLGIRKEACHISMFDLETCRRAWVALKGATAPDIRAWAKARKEDDGTSSGQSADLAPVN